MGASGWAVFAAESPNEIRKRSEELSSLRADASEALTAVVQKCFRPR